MEKRIQQLYNDQVLEMFIARYEIAPNDIQLLDGFESFIYQFTKGKKAYILRIGHSSRRSINLIRGEVEWTNYLSAGGASVARAVPAASGLMVESVEDGSGGDFLATAFDKAPGTPPKREMLNSELYVRYGKLLGRMHTLSREYRPSNEEWKRMDWNDPQMLDAQNWLGSDNEVTLEKYWQLRSHLDSLPLHDQDYGLIHQDAHYGNFFIDENGQITLFDFDDCCYSWFINDIAIVLFYAVIGQDDEETFTRDFMANFLRGYRQENDLDSEWLMEIPRFLKLREIDLYAVIHRSFDVDNLDNAWVANYMRGRKQRIENDKPFIDFDFEELGGL